MKQTGKIEYKGIRPANQKEISALVAKAYYAEKRIAELEAKIKTLKLLIKLSGDVLQKAEVYVPFGGDVECLIDDHLKQIKEVSDD